MRNSVIQLYRGDSTKIKEFETSKTNKECLVGQGVYLTDKESVADTYRTKARWSGEIPFFKCAVRANNKNEAKELAKIEFIKHRTRIENVGSKPRPDFVRKISDLFSEMIDKDEINISRTEAVWLPSVTIHKGSTKEKRVPDPDRRPKFDFEEKTRNRIGFVTSFVFPEPMFTNNLLNVDTPVLDKDLIEILHDSYLWRKDYERLKEYPPGSTPPYQRFMNEVQRSNGDRFGFHLFHVVDFNKLRSVVTPLGIHGFEYQGGRHVGGKGFHRAFCVFDSDFVNDHRVGQYR